MIYPLRKWYPCIWVLILQPIRLRWNKLHGMVAPNTLTCCLSHRCRGTLFLHRWARMAARASPNHRRRSYLSSDESSDIADSRTSGQQVQCGSISGPWPLRLQLDLVHLLPPSLSSRLIPFCSFHSLNFGNLLHTHSLFVHVPPFEKIPKRVQLEFVRQLLRTIADLL